MGTTFAPATFEPIAAFLVRDHGYPADMVVLAMREEMARVDMHRGGASAVMPLLGFEPSDEGWVGECDPADFLGRVLLALALEPADEGSPGYSQAVGSPDEAMLPLGSAAGRWHVMPRAAGDIQRRLDDLRVLAELCVAEGMLVGWC